MVDWQRRSHLAGIFLVEDDRGGIVFDWVKRKGIGFWERVVAIERRDGWVGAVRSAALPG